MDKNFTGWKDFEFTHVYYVNGKEYLSAANKDAKRYIEYLFDVGGLPIARANYAPTK